MDPEIGYLRVSIEGRLILNLEVSWCHPPPSSSKCTLGAGLAMPTADLDRLVLTHSLPDDTRERVRTALEPLREFPRLGPDLAGRWEGFRFVLGPWRWMLLVYLFDEARDRVALVTIQDARTSRAATGEHRS